MTPQTPNPPDLLSDEDLRWWADDADERYDDDDPPLMAAELLRAREVIRALIAGSYSDENPRAEGRDYLLLRALGPSLWGNAGGDYETLVRVRPDLARYLAALEALPQEDSR